MKTPTKTLIQAMRILSRDIQSDDGVANAAIAEAADRLDQFAALEIVGYGFTTTTIDGGSRGVDIDRIRTLGDLIDLRNAEMKESE
jgi:hypothetical protein